MTTTAEKSGQFPLGDRSVHRIGYGAMQLAGPHVMGPPADRDGAIAVLRRAVELGVDHIDTSDYYGPHVTNEIIREALHPYPPDLTIVTKIGARRTADAGRRLGRGAVPRRDPPGAPRQPRSPRRRRDRRGEPADAGLQRAGAALARRAVRDAGRAAAGGADQAPRRQQRDPADAGRGAVDRAGRLRAEPLQPRA